MCNSPVGDGANRTLTGFCEEACCEEVDCIEDESFAVVGLVEGYIAARIIAETLKRIEVGRIKM
jgi:hypothetical protein